MYAPIWKSRADASDIPRNAVSSLSTARRSPRTSSFSRPVSPLFSSSYNSSFSSCKSFARCVSAVVTVLERDPACASPAIVLMWGSSKETNAGGREMGSVLDGPGCVDRYWRRWDTSS